MTDADNFAVVSHEKPQFRRPALVRGPRLSFRDACPDDAAFILSLRLDPEKNAHLSATSPDLAQQSQWLTAYQSDPKQLYFIIEYEGRTVGTVRLYDQRGDSFSWGSWILSADAPKSAAVESTLMVYRVGLELGFNAAHFDVRKANEKVWQYHERLGAKRVSETDIDYIYSISRTDILAAIERYRDRGVVTIDWTLPG